METNMELMGVTDWMPAAVPGGVHVELYRQGLIEHPYTDLNSWNCEWVENRWWVYKTSFPRPESGGKRIELVLKGLDYEALIYFNRHLLGEHEGMYHAAVYDVTELIAQAETTELMIILKHAPDEMAQIGKTSETFTQKSRFNYKWDFSTRLVNLGIWDDIVLRVHEELTFQELAVHTDVAESGTGLVKLAVAAASFADGLDLKQARLRARLSDPAGNCVADEQLELDNALQVDHTLEVQAPQLWYPNGYGAQPLYRLELELVLGGKVVDSYSQWTGIRKLAYAHNEREHAGALPYTFVINDTKIYIRGANLTPLDHVYGNIAPERYEWMVQLAKAANMNMIRVWGGGIIEKKQFYELCDRHGILVWQEFIQSSSGVDNIPSKKPRFLELLKQTAVAALKDRRNHVSLTVWSGGNELMSEPNRPSTYADENLAMLKTLVEQFDAQRMFLPTSASGPIQYVTEKKGISHDIHGHWKYQGNPNHYTLYGQSDSLFHSEFGVDGLSSVKSIRKFISPVHHTPVSMEESLVWRHHGEWWDTFGRESKLFGTPQDLHSFAKMSQWMQGEGLRFILEANRRRKFQNSGSLIWQLNEPFPNISCTNLVDYYGETKQAYHMVKQTFAALHASLDYARLDYKPGETFASGLYVHSHKPGAAKVRAEVLDASGAVLVEQTFSGMVELNRSLQIGMLQFEVPRTDRGLFFVRVYVQLTDESDGGSDRGRNGGSNEGSDGEQLVNLYTFSTCAADEELFKPALALQGELLVEFVGEEGNLGESRGLGNSGDSEDLVDSADLVDSGDSADAAERGVWKRISGQGLVEGAVEWTRTYTLKNKGKEVALFIYAEETTDAYWLQASQAYFSLFPGESITLTVNCVAKTKDAFETMRDAVPVPGGVPLAPAQKAAGRTETQAATSGAVMPEIVFDYFNKR